MDHLADAERPWVRRKLRAAWANPNAGEAEAALRALAGQLERVHPDAAASLREGLAETVTVTRLGVTGSLLNARRVEPVPSRERLPPTPPARRRARAHHQHARRRITRSYHSLNV